MIFFLKRIWEAVELVVSRMEAVAEQEVRLLQQQVIGIQTQDGGVHRRSRGGLAVAESPEGETGAIQDFCEQGLGYPCLFKGLQRFRINNNLSFMTSIVLVTLQRYLFSLPEYGNCSRSFFFAFAEGKMAGIRPWQQEKTVARGEIAGSGPWRR